MELRLEHREKKWLLDILAYFLWADSDCFPLSFKSFANELYQCILQELVEEYHRKHNQEKDQQFHSFDTEVRLLGELFYLEQRMKRLERR